MLRWNRSVLRTAASAARRTSGAVCRPATVAPLASRRWQSNDPFVGLTLDHREALNKMEKILAMDDPQERKEITCQLVKDLTVHSVIEEIHVYPLIKRINTIDDPEMVTANMISEHNGLKLKLIKLDEYISSLKDKPSERWPNLPTNLVEDLQKMLREHAKAEEEDLFPRLKETLDAVDLASLCEKLEAERKWAPTHPIHIAPNKPIFTVMADRVAEEIADKFKAKEGQRHF